MTPACVKERIYSIVTSTFLLGKDGLIYRVVTESGSIKMAKDIDLVTMSIGQANAVSPPIDLSLFLP